MEWCTCLNLLMINSLKEKVMWPLIVTVTVHLRAAVCLAVFFLTLKLSEGIVYLAGMFGMSPLECLSHWFFFSVWSHLHGYENTSRSRFIKINYLLKLITVCGIDFGGDFLVVIFGIFGDFRVIFGRDRFFWQFPLESQSNLFSYFH